MANQQNQNQNQNREESSQKQKPMAKQQQNNKLDRQPEQARQPTEKGDW